jgi:hypothetical protein
MREQVAGFADADSRELDLQILFRIDHNSVNYHSLTPRFVTSPCHSIIYVFHNQGSVMCAVRLPPKKQDGLHHLFY